MLKAVGIVFTAVVSMQTAFAGMPDIKIMQKDGMTALMRSVVKLSKTPSAEGCPASGAEEVVVNYNKTTTILDIQTDMAEANNIVAQKAKSLAKDGGKCGACQQLNVVSPASMILPEIDKGQDPHLQIKCASYPAVQFSKKFASDEEGQQFILDAFKQGNEEGEKMFKTCPGECSFYVYVATTNLAGGRKNLNMTVQCGPPKLSEGFSGMDSPYHLSTRMIHEWTCAQSKN